MVVTPMNLSFSNINDINPNRKITITRIKSTVNGDIINGGQVENEIQTVRNTEQIGETVVIKNKANSETKIHEQSVSEIKYEFNLITHQEVDSRMHPDNNECVGKQLT